MRFTILLPISLAFTASLAARFSSGSDFDLELSARSPYADADADAFAYADADADADPDADADAYAEYDTDLYARSAEAFADPLAEYYVDLLESRDLMFDDDLVARAAAFGGEEDELFARGFFGDIKDKVSGAAEKTKDWFQENLG